MKILECTGQIWGYTTDIARGVKNIAGKVWSATTDNRATNAVCNVTAQTLTTLGNAYGRVSGAYTKENFAKGAKVTTIGMVGAATFGAFLKATGITKRVSALFSKCKQNWNQNEKARAVVDATIGTLWLGGGTVAAIYLYKGGKWVAGKVQERCGACEEMDAETARCQNIMQNESFRHLNSGQGLLKEFKSKGCELYAQKHFSWIENIKEITYSE